MGGLTDREISGEGKLYGNNTQTTSVIQQGPVVSRSVRSESVDRRPSCFRSPSTLGTPFDPGRLAVVDGDGPHPAQIPPFPVIHHRHSNALSSVPLHPKRGGGGPPTSRHRLIHVSRTAVVPSLLPREAYHDRLVDADSFGLPNFTRRWRPPRAPVANSRPVGKSIFDTCMKMDRCLTQA